MDKEKLFYELALFFAENDQEIMKAKEWIRDTSTDSVMGLWDLMNAEFDNDLVEIMSNFAIIGFTHVLESICEQSKQREQGKQSDN